MFKDYNEAVDFIKATHQKYELKIKAPYRVEFSNRMRSCLGRCREYAQNYKQEAVQKTGILRNLEGFIKVYMIDKNISEREYQLCKTIIDYINFRDTNKLSVA